MVFENLFSLTDFSSFLLFEAFDNSAWDRYLRVISHVSSRIGTRNWHNSVAVSSKNKAPPGPSPVSINKMNKPAVTQPL